MRAVSPHPASCIIRRYDRSQHESATVRFSSLTSCQLSPSWRAPPFPAEFNGNAIQPVEGESFLPALTGADWQRQKPLYWEHEGNRAVRIGDWKLVSKHPGDWELYNLIEDRTELSDLSERRARTRRQNARPVRRLGSSLRSARLAPVLISPAAAPTCCTGEPVARPRSPETCRGDTCVALYYPKTVRATLGSPFMTPKL